MSKLFWAYNDLKVNFRAVFSYFYLFRFRTQVSHQKSLNIFLRPLYSVYNDMTEDFFYAKSLMGTPHDSIFFTDFFFQLRSRAQEDIQIKFASVS